ncbi:MAG TPA: DUF2147 domain-containing protein, partial [Acinetobacter sp.]|nr:DUF2147 domain-containing protein [Acinetobacter sp.]
MYTKLITLFLFMGLSHLTFAQD